MTDTPNYRLKFEIVDVTTGNAIVVDFCSFSADSVDQFGGCEATDHQVAAAMRAFRHLRTKHEAENYPKNDKQLVTQTAARIRAAAEG